MNLLLTNDDGYNADGIKVLAKTLAKKHNVYVVAPSSNRSAVSNHITIFNSTEIKVISDRVWSCSGMPTDCVCVGLESNLCGVKFDAVISGINGGSNIGTDIIYSGTCSAARQAVLLGVPAVALSLDPVDWERAVKEGFKYQSLADFALNNLEKLLSMAETDINKDRKFVNVNGASLGSYKGVKYAGILYKKTYEDSLEIVPEGDHLKAIYHMGNAKPLWKDKNCDQSICLDGYISVSSVFVDPTCMDSAEDFQLSCN